jgi:sulfatase maturation enzyme AslB (radical SAM superfamily)
MIHGGLQINLKIEDDSIHVNHCCLRADTFKIDTTNIWNALEFLPLRQLNDQNKWDPGCWTCQGNENAGLTSFRTGMIEQFGERKNLSGPQRIDIMFDIGCNLACRTCGPHSSTFWQKHLKESNISFDGPLVAPRVNEMIEILKTLDLSNLESVVFCGGETLLGQGYWQVADAIANLVHDSVNQITLSFQTNGTQPIHKKNYKIIERFRLLKLNISLDGVGGKFNYLRWPAEWEQVVKNIITLKDTLPTNTMFLIEETISIFNLYYYSELDSWAKQNFSTNRLGDITNHTRHVAHGIFSLDNLSQEYVDAMQGTALSKLIRNDWKENTTSITEMIATIQQFDKIRNQNWAEVFPEVPKFYSRFL